MSPIEQQGKTLTPADYLTKMRDEQGDRPDAWARSLISLITLGLLPENEAGEYAQCLADASGKQTKKFWDTYNSAIKRWKES
jgi:hypothetical protein